MKQAWAIGNLNDEVLRTSAQFGVENIIIYAGPGGTTFPGTGRPLSKPRAEYIDYLAMRREVESSGLKIAAAESGFSIAYKVNGVQVGGNGVVRRPERVVKSLVTRLGLRRTQHADMPFPDMDCLVSRFFQ